MNPVYSRIQNIPALLLLIFVLLFISEYFDLNELLFYLETLHGSLRNNQLASITRTGELQPLQNKCSERSKEV